MSTSKMNFKKGSSILPWIQFYSKQPLEKQTADALTFKRIVIKPFSPREEGIFVPTLFLMPQKK